MSAPTDPLARLASPLIVSVQADDGSPLRDTAHIVALARAALLGGAGGCGCARPRTSAPCAP
ncbi:hypothetical protein [Deinococcus wulumuqiensis]|uniref:hypothetical protein n=1 Tax=Deinococcus wulumuqiensis TaxID=980427 RepID=UPI001F07C33F|nr:hypothetical protein [Deinococcus wulumuqiensis]